MTPDTDKETGKKIYAYDPHIDPSLQWAGKAEIDSDLIEAYRGTLSLPFEIEDNRRIAVKIVDDRGIESLKIMEID